MFTPYIIGVVWLKNVGGWKLVTSLGQRLDIGMSAGMDTENVVNIFSSYFPVIFLYSSAFLSLVTFIDSSVIKSEKLEPAQKIRGSFNLIQKTVMFSHYKVLISHAPSVLIFDS